MSCTKDNIIKSSIKPDKRYWIVNKRKTENIQKWLIQLYLLSELYPNSGTLDTQMKEFLVFFKKSNREYENIETLLSLVTEIACRNPRVVPTAIGILSILVDKIESNEEKIIVLKRIHNKFQQIPNSSFLKVWLQRFTLKLDRSIIYDDPICKIVSESNVQLWNIDWLRDNFKEKIKKTPIIIQSKVKTLKPVVTKKEIDIITTSNAYDYEEVNF